MGKNSKIEWTDHTFNPWIGCKRFHRVAIIATPKRKMRFASGMVVRGGRMRRESGPQ